MPAQEWALESLWENIGVLGPSSETGTPKDATSGGPRQLHSNCSLIPSSFSTAQANSSNDMETTQESSKAGGKAPARMPKPTLSSDGYIRSSRPQGQISTHSTSPVSTTQPTVPPEAFLDPQANSFLLSPSPLLSDPTFEMRQNLQFGPGIANHHLSATNNAAMMANVPPSADTSRESARKSAQPRPPGTTHSCLQNILAKNRDSRRRISSPYSTTSQMPHTTPPTRPHCPAKERLLKWRPLLTTTTLPTNEDLEKSYQLTAAAFEPSTLSSYASRLLVFHVWSDSKGLPEAERTSVAQSTIASFITDLAGAYAGDTIANYIQGLKAWHTIYNIP